MVVDGDHEQRQRFAQWVEDHGKAVRGFLLAMVRRDDVADDLCQEVFCRAWQARDRYADQGKARAYLLQIANRLVCDRSRRNEPKTNLDDETWRIHEPPSQSPGPAAGAMLNEQVGLLHAALDRLAPLQQRVLLLRYYGQMDFQEIAETLQMPLNTAVEPLPPRSGDFAAAACGNDVMNDSNDQRTMRLKQMLEDATATDRPISGDPEAASLRDAWLAFSQLAAAADDSLPAPPAIMPSITTPKPRRVQWAGLIAAAAAGLLLAITCGWWFARDAEQANSNGSNGEPSFAAKPAPEKAAPQVVKQDSPKMAIVQTEKTPDKVVTSRAAVKIAAKKSAAWDDPLDTQITSVSQEFSDVEENWQHRVDDVDLVQYRIDEVSSSLQNDAL